MFPGPGAGAAKPDLPASRRAHNREWKCKPAGTRCPTAQPMIWAGHTLNIKTWLFLQKLQGWLKKGGGEDPFKATTATASPSHGGFATRSFLLMAVWSCSTFHKLYSVP